MNYIKKINSHLAYLLALGMLTTMPFRVYARHGHERGPLLVAQAEVIPTNATNIGGTTQPIQNVVAEQATNRTIPEPSQAIKQRTEYLNNQPVPPVQAPQRIDLRESESATREVKSSAPAPAFPKNNTPRNNSAQKPVKLADVATELPLAFQHEQRAQVEDEASARKALKSMEKEDNNIEFNFENADLLNLVTQVEEIFGVRFIPDDIVDPLRQGRKALRGNKISFKTNKPLNKRQAWSLFVTFLNLAGLTITPYPDDPNMYFVTTIKNAYTMPTPTFIGVDYEKLPTTDQMIRYVYFVENMTTETLKKIVDSLKSSDAVALELKSNRALLIIDKAYNVRELLKIVKELDQSSMPQAMSVMKLRFADAKQVEELYKTLTQATDSQPVYMGPRKQPTSLYFPENMRVIAEPRTNAIILLGDADSIQKVEKFISENIDIDLEQPYARLFKYQVLHADAKAIADIMNNVTAFGKDLDVGKNGGVRGQDKYLRPMLFVAEPATNSIIVRGHYEDYMRAKEVMDQLDAPQPQVGIEVLILTVSLTQINQLGTQLRSKQTNNGLLGNNVKFQTSGLNGNGIVQNLSSSLGVDRILGNLVNLAQGAAVGNTIVTFGQDIVNGALSVWGIFAALQSVVDTTVVSNPFLVTTNKTTAAINLGEQRRVQTSNIINSSNQGTPTFDNSQAFLKVKITPQINSDGMIVLDIQVDINDFTFPANSNNEDPRNAEQQIKSIKSNVIVANKEVIALGGLVKSQYSTSTTKTPLLGDIPLLGWLFKNKSKTNDKDSLLVLISTRIIDPHRPDDIVDFTAERMSDYYAAMEASINKPDRRDPINKWFFDPLDKGDALVDQFVEDQNSGVVDRKRAEKRAHRKKKATKKAITASAKPAKEMLKNSGKPLRVEQTPNQNHAPQTFSDILAQKAPAYDMEKDLLARVKNKKRTSLSLNDYIQPQKGKSA